MIMKTDFTLVLLVLLTGVSFGEEVSKRKGAFPRLVENLEAVKQEVADMTAKLDENTAAIIELQNSLEDFKGSMGNKVDEIDDSIADIQYDLSQPACQTSIVKLTDLTGHKEATITFDPPFKRQPKVGVAFLVLAAPIQTQIKVSCSQRQVGTHGFTLRCGVWDNFRAYEITATWIAC